MKSQLFSLSIFALENGEGGEAGRGHVDADAAKWWVTNPPYKKPLSLRTLRSL
jgi:hypothetical protein